MARKREQFLQVFLRAVRFISRKEGKSRNREEGNNNFFTNVM